MQVCAGACGVASELPQIRLVNGEATAALMWGECDALRVPVGECLRQKRCRECSVGACDAPPGNRGAPRCHDLPHLPWPEANNLPDLTVCRNLPGRNSFYAAQHALDCEIIEAACGAVRGHR